MKCKVPERQIYHLCDGLLPEEERAALEAHVAACGRCGRVYREARATLDILKCPAPAAAASLLDDAAVRAAIDRGLALGSRPPRLLELAPKKLPLRFLAAAAVFVFAAISLMHLALGLQSRNRRLLLRAWRAPGVSGKCNFHLDKGHHRHFQQNVRLKGVPQFECNSSSSTETHRAYRSRPRQRARGRP